jgi:outer membrane immunogenic protein
MRYLSIAVVATVSAVAFTQNATAADMPVKAPVAPVPAPIYSWTGFYVGVHAGWGWSSSTVTVTPSPAFVSASGYETNLFDQNSDGFIGGGQIGYNWQFAPNWMVGIEGDFSGTGIRETTIAPITIGGVSLGGDYTHTTKRDITWLASVRGRLGYTADRWLIYVTGGGAWGRVEGTAGPNIPSILTPVTFSDTISGWVIGGGFEYAIANNWTARLEYLYYDLDDTSFTNAYAGNPTFFWTTTWDNRINVVRAAVNYKF